MRVLSIVFMLLLMISLVTLPVTAQEEVDVEYGETTDFELNEDDDEVIFVFEGSEGDVISIQVSVEYNDNLDYEATIEMELEDEDEDLVERGESLSYLYTNPAMVVELENDGEYRVRVQFNGDGEATVVLLIEETVFLTDEPATFSVANVGLPTLFGVLVEDDGLYEIRMVREDEDFTSFDFSLLTFDSGNPLTLGSIYGSSVWGWSLIVELEEGENYVGVMGDSLSLLFDSDRPERTDVSVSITPFED